MPHILFFPACPSLQEYFNSYVHKHTIHTCRDTHAYEGPASAREKVSSSSGSRVGSWAGQQSASMTPTQWVSFSSLRLSSLSTLGFVLKYNIMEIFKRTTTAFIICRLLRHAYLHLHALPQILHSKVSTSTCATRGPGYRRSSSDCANHMHKRIYA